MNNNIQMGYDGGFMMNGMDPNPGDQMRGTWISKITGKSVTVRDCVISGDGMSVMLADGRMIDMNDFSNEYYQMSEEEYDMNGNKIPGGHRHDGHINVPSYDARPDGPDLPPSFPGHQHPKPDCGCDKPAPIPPRPCPPRPRPDFGPDPVGDAKRRMDMITDVFSKVSPEPKVEGNVTLTVENFPKEQLQMIIDIFGVNVEDVAAYLYRYYYTPEKIIAYLKDYLVNTDEVQLKDKEAPKVDDNKSDEDTDYAVGD